MEIFAETYSTVQNTKTERARWQKKQACGLKGTYKDSQPLLVMQFYITTKTERYLPSKIFVCINDYRSEANPDNHHLYTMHHSRPMHTDGENDYITYIHCTILQSYRQDPDNATKMKKQIPNEIYSANESNTANLSSLNHAAAPDSPLYHAPAPDTGRDLSPHHARSSDVSWPVGHAPTPDTERDLSEFTSSI